MELELDPMLDNAPPEEVEVEADIPTLRAFSLGSYFGGFLLDFVILFFESLVQPMEILKWSPSLAMMPSMSSGSNVTFTGSSTVEMMSLPRPRAIDKRNVKKKQE